MARGYWKGSSGIEHQISIFDSRYPMVNIKKKLI